MQSMVFPYSLFETLARPFPVSEKSQINATECTSGLEAEPRLVRPPPESDAVPFFAVGGAL